MGEGFQNRKHRSSKAIPNILETSAKEKLLIFFVLSYSKSAYSGPSREFFRKSFHLKVTEFFFCLYLYFLPASDFYFNSDSSSRGKDGAPQGTFSRGTNKIQVSQHAKHVHVSQWLTVGQGKLQLLHLNHMAFESKQNFLFSNQRPSPSLLLLTSVSGECARGKGSSSSRSLWHTRL